MFKTILFLAIILKLALGEDTISWDDDDEISTVKISMGTFNALAPYIELYNDELEEEMVKTCKQIKKEKVCMNAVSSKYPDGRQTDKRYNAAKGECMWFHKRNHPIVRALGNRCLAPAAVMRARQNGVAMEADIDEEEEDEDEDEDDIDDIEMPEELFDGLSANAPINEEDLDDEMMKYCLDIKGERVCVNGVSRIAPGGVDTGRRGNDGPGECMWFDKKRNHVVEALGNRCLPPAHVLFYKRNNVICNDCDDDEDDEDDAINTIEISMKTWDTLSLYMDDDDIFVDARQIVGCKRIRSKRECVNKGVTAKGEQGVGANTGRRGNDGPGECMYFNKRRNPIVLALGSRCLAPAAVISYKKANRPPTTMDDDDDDDIDSIEMDEGLFDTLSANAPDEDDMDDMDDIDLSADGRQIVGCKSIRSKRECVNKGVSPSGANGQGILTGRKGNEGKGECMYFNKADNPIVQALGSRCLPPKAVITYKKANRPPPTMEHEFFAALGLINEENDELNYNALSMVFVMMVLIGFGAYYKLCQNNNKNKQESLLNAQSQRSYQYQSV